jgi:hypothetical protein
MANTMENPMDETSPGLVRRITGMGGKGVLYTLLFFVLTFGSNALVDVLVQYVNGGCLPLDSGTEICVKRIDPPVATN